MCSQKMSDFHRILLLHHHPHLVVSVEEDPTRMKELLVLDEVAEIGFSGGARNQTVGSHI